MIFNAVYKSGIFKSRSQCCSPPRHVLSFPLVRGIQIEVLLRFLFVPYSLLIKSQVFLIHYSFMNYFSSPGIWYFTRFVQQRDEKTTGVTIKQEVPPFISTWWYLLGALPEGLLCLFISFLPMVSATLVMDVIVLSQSTFYYNQFQLYFRLCSVLIRLRGAVLQLMSAFFWRLSNKVHSAVSATIFIRKCSWTDYIL